MCLHLSFWKPSLGYMKTKRDPDVEPHTAYDALGR